MKMPFGKYKGYEVSDIDTSYLVYIFESFTLTSALRNEIKTVIEENLYDLGLFQNEIIKEENTSIKQAYFQLAKKYHPDKGGNTQAMQCLNEFYNLIK